MAFIGVRHTKKLSKKVELALEELTKAKDLLDYCNDTKGLRCDGRPDEVDSSKEHAFDTALDHMFDAAACLKDALDENDMG